MGKKKNTWSSSYELPLEPLLDDNPFLEALFEHMNSAEGQLYREVSDTLGPLLDELHVDAKQRLRSSGWTARGSIWMNQCKKS